MHTISSNVYHTDIKLIQWHFIRRLERNVGETMIAPRLYSCGGARSQFKPDSLINIIYRSDLNYGAGSSDVALHIYKRLCYLAVFCVNADFTDPLAILY